MRFVLLLPPGVRAELKALAGAVFLEATCGLLLGRRERVCCIVLTQQPVRNMNRERARDRFSLAGVKSVIPNIRLKSTQNDLRGSVQNAWSQRIDSRIAALIRPTML
jgi:hypothetical protein